MRKLVLALLLVTSTAHAGEFKLGTEVSHFKYEEPGVMQEEGVMYGLTGSYELWWKRIMLRPELRGAVGQVNYSSKNTGTIDNIDDYQLEGRLLAGFKANKHITPFIGLGYRYLNDDSSGMKSSTGQSGYLRESNYLYIPVGFEAKLGSWPLKLSAEMDVLVRGKQESHLSVIPGIPDFENEQKHGYGARASLVYTYRNFSIGPFVRYWEIEDSEPVPFEIFQFIEPDNNSLEVGVSASLKF